MVNSRATNVDKYLYLSSIKANNIDLFYRLLIDHVAQMMPLVYTPTIGDVCLQYSTLYTRPEALYISIKQRKSIATILRNWPHPDPSICVVTDGSRILGLGDLGVNGVGISVCTANCLDRPMLIPTADWQVGTIHCRCRHPPREDTAHRSRLRYSKRGQPPRSPIPWSATETRVSRSCLGIHGRIHGGSKGSLPQHAGSI